MNDHGRIEGRTRARWQLKAGELAGLLQVDPAPVTGWFERVRHRGRSGLTAVARPPRRSQGGLDRTRLRDRV